MTSFEQDMMEDWYGRIDPERISEEADFKCHVHIKLNSDIFLD